MATNEERWSVGSLMKVSMYAAVNFAVFRAVGKVGPLFVILLLTILNLLFFWFSRWNRGRADRQFWDWFELVGWGMIGLSVTFADLTSYLLIAPMDWLADREWIGRNGRATTFLYILGAIVIYGLFPLAVATFAGWMSSRPGVLIGRRHHPECEGDPLVTDEPAQMVRKGHLSIGQMMAVVFLIAIDIALIQDAYYPTRPQPRPSPGYLAIILPMANLLVLTLPRLRRVGDARRFWVGFQVVGWGCILTLGYLDQYAKNILFFPYMWLRSFLFFPRQSTPDIAIVYTFFVIGHTPPQLLLAWLGGRLAQRLGRLPVKGSEP